MSAFAYCREGHLLTVDKEEHYRGYWRCHCEPCGDLCDPEVVFCESRAKKEDAVAEYVANHGGSTLELPETFTPLQALEFCHHDPSIIASPAKLSQLLYALAACQFAAGVERGRETANQTEDTE